MIYQDATATLTESTVEIGLSSPLGTDFGLTLSAARDLHGSLGRLLGPKECTCMAYALGCESLCYCGGEA